MKKKVVDIFSPKELEKKTRLSLPETKATGEQAVKKFEKKGLILGLPILILVFFFCYFTLSKADIEVWPEAEVLTFETKLTIDKTAETLNFSAKVIPGEILEKEKTVTEKFSSTGKILKEEKAEGLIRIYNNHSTNPQVLIATTRFLSAEGKLFRITTRVTIPGGNYEKGKFIPGEIDARVTADQPGSEYNIGPSTFSIPGFAGTARYTRFYAKSFQEMTGGASQELFQVTKKDLEAAEEILIKRAKEGSEAALKNELQSEEITTKFNFLEKAVLTEVVEKFSLVKAGDEKEDFNFQVKAKSKTLIFKKEDFENFVKEFINSQIPQEKKLYEKSLKIDYFGETINLKSGKITLSLEILANIYSDIDIFTLKNRLKGLSLSATKFFLGNQPKITKIKVKFWPFWVKKVPKDLDKIELKLILDPVRNSE